jgi:hypothetical protein
VEVLTAIAGVVSALAALGALVFAWMTVREAAAARREERDARERDRLEEVAELAREIAATVTGGNPYMFPVEQARLSAALAARSAELSDTAALLEFPQRHPHDGGGTEIREASIVALREIAAALSASGRRSSPGG